GRLVGAPGRGIAARLRGLGPRGAGTGRDGSRARPAPHRAGRRPDLIGGGADGTGGRIDPALVPDHHALLLIAPLVRSVAGHFVVPSPGSSMISASTTSSSALARASPAAPA